MACFPKIDQPCPLDRDAQRRIAGHCGRCDKTVHALDAMDDVERAALLRDAAAPVCVSYRLPLGLGAALALSMAGSALAADAGSTANPSLFESVDAREIADTSDMAMSAISPAADSDDAIFGDDGLDMVFVGGVTDPTQAVWVDDSNLPELPILHESVPRSD